MSEIEWLTSNDSIIDQEGNMELMDIDVGASAALTSD